MWTPNSAGKKSHNPFGAADGVASGAPFAFFDASTPPGVAPTGASVGRCDGVGDPPTVVGYPTLFIIVLLNSFFLTCQCLFSYDSHKTSHTPVCILCTREAYPFFEDHRLSLVSYRIN